MIGCHRLQRLPVTEALRLGEIAAGESLEVAFRFDCLLSQQDYTITAATQHFDGSSQDWLDDVLSFRVIDPRGAAGVASFRTDVAFRKY